MTLLALLQSANETAIHKASSALEDSIARSNFEALWEWCDSWPFADQSNLSALARDSGAEAVDIGFVDTLLDDMWNDETQLLASDSERQAQLLAYFARRPALTDAERAAVQAYADAAFPRGEKLNRPDVGSRVQIIRDLVHTCPGGGTDAFVRDYVRELPPGWRDSIVLDLKAGEHPVVCRWTATREKISATQAWCRNYRYRDQPRFEALESLWFEGERVVIPAAVSRATVTIEQLAKPRITATPSTVTPTGLEPLDAVLATGGIPSGARVGIQASTAQGKTALMLEIAEAWAARGARVVWVATADEPRESVMARRRQRHGMPRAQALTSTDETALEPRLFVVDGRDHTIEEVLALSPAPALLVLDPVSKVRMRDGAADPVVRIGGVLDLVEASGWTVLMSAPVVRGAGRRVATERALGGSRIEAGATLLLELSRSGDNLTIGVVKSRLGGEGMEVALRLDAERQRVLAAPSDAGALSVEERIWRDVRAVLATDGPRVARALADKVRGRKTAVLAVVRQRLATGELRQVEGKVGLP
ncbi:MAG: DnaB-like helicase terminal domain [Polyangiaceae bacterium]|jgi:hypothetical protein|nr:DnaB-like helicase terminal domain [Polyangiaceae bacterium]